jgi:short-subunit dehydrogenase
MLIMGVFAALTYSLAAYGVSKTLAALWRLQLNKAWLPNSTRLARTSEYGEGSWAMVVKPNTRVGKSLAKLLAERGFNILLVDTDRSMLKQLAAELGQVQVKSIIFDVNKSMEPASVKSLTTRIKGLDISILVNNEGTAQLLPKRFLKHTPDELTNHLTSTCGALTLMTQLILPQMKVRKERSAVISISSGLGFKSTPYFQPHSASSAFTHTLLPSIGIENEGRVDTLVICQDLPKLLTSKSPSADAEHIAVNALEKLGLTPITIESHQVGLLLPKRSEGEDRSWIEWGGELSREYFRRAP